MSVEEVLEKETDRFFTEGHKTRELLENIADKFTNFEEFVEAVKEEFSKDASLRNFLDDIRSDNDFKPLFEHRIVQNWLSRNNDALLVKAVMTKYKVEPIKAVKVVNRLSSKDKLKLLLQIEKRKERMLRKYIIKETKPKVRKYKPIKQKFRGKIYIRSKPRRFSVEEVTFIKNALQKNKPSKVYEIYNSISIFRKLGRTKSSVMTKVYRVRKSLNLK